MPYEPFLLGVGVVFNLLNPQFQAKRSQSAKAILGALGAFWGILRAALGVQRIILGMRNPILGMASHDFCNAKTTILGATPGAIPGIHVGSHEGFHLPMRSRSFFSKIGVVPRAREINSPIFFAPAFVMNAPLTSWSHNRGPQ